MEKIILNNKQEFEIIPMGISEDTAKKRRSFKFISILYYEEIKTIFSNSENLSSIDYVLADGTRTTFADCVSYKGLGFTPDYQIDDITVSDIYSVTISTDILEQGMKILLKEIAEQKIVNSQVNTSFEELMLDILPAMENMILEVKGGE